jgi:hypothetical protein
VKEFFREEDEEQRLAFEKWKREKPDEYAAWCRKYEGQLVAPNPLFSSEFGRYYDAELKDESSRGAPRRR